VAVGDGYTALLLGFPERGQGAVVLTNTGLSGLTLAVDIAQRLAVQYGWPTLPKLGG
jgi:hypothetical protein